MTRTDTNSEEGEGKELGEWVVPEQLPLNLLQAGVYSRLWCLRNLQGPTKPLLPSVMRAREERLGERITPEALRRRGSRCFINWFLTRIVRRYAGSCDVVRSRFNVTRSWYEGYTSAKQKLKVYSLVLGTYIIQMITILIISTDNSMMIK
jgi:hypothetical protein